MSAITCRVVSPQLRADPRLFAEYVRALLRVIVPVNVIEIRNGNLPGLYESGVRFQPEPKGVESFVDILSLYAKGFGDCAHLAAARVAFLNVAGEKATLRVTWRVKPGSRLFHVQVRRGDGSIEDPSRILGMGQDQIAGLDWNDLL